MTKSKEDIEDYIKREIRKSGFPLEITSSITLNKHGWVVTPHMIFYNKEKKEYSELDIHAMNWTKGFDKRARTRDILIVQCKKQTQKPWVFFQQDKVNKNVFSLNITPLDLYGWFKKYFKNHYYFGKKPCSYHVPTFVSGRKRDVILKAINQVIDALLFFFDQELAYIEEHGGKRVSFFYPVIILDGRLFSARVEPGGEIETAETKYLQLQVTRAVRELLKVRFTKYESRVLFSKAFIIDIVEKSFLGEFLKNFS